MIKQYKKYSDVPKKYKYDLEFLLEGKTKEKLLEEILKILDSLIEIKESKYNSKEEFLESIKINEKMEIKINKLMNYISNTLSTNVVDAEMVTFQKKVEFEFYKKQQQLGPEDAIFFKNSKKIEKWLNLKEFSIYKKNIKAKLDDKKHQLSEEIEKFRQKESRADISTLEVFNILSNSELDFGYAISTNGKKIKITNANRTLLLKNKDKNIRKTTTISYRDGFLKHKQTFSNLLYQHFKKETVWSSLEKFDKTIDSLLYSDRVSEKMLLQLYSSIQNNKDIFKKYEKHWKKFYKIKFGEKPTKYDRQVDLIKVKTEYSIEETIDKVKKALKPFGKEYNNILDKALNENWIDFMVVKNKMSGAYSIGSTHGIEKKLISMNFDGTLRSISTLAHEIGHSIHSYFSDKNQHQANSQYPIFLAEIASIFNELMLYDDLLSSSKDDKLKFYIYEEMISGFIGTTLVQVEWSNFEYDMYRKIEKGEVLSSYETISKLYYENNQKYSIKKKKFDPKNSWAGVIIPHFYYNFYVYKYAIGQLCAMIFFEKYKQNGKKELQFYIDKFLSAGNKDWPLEILKEAGIDLLDDKTYELGFNRVSSYIEEWIKLGNKIFTSK